MNKVHVKMLRELRRQFKVVVDFRLLWGQPERDRYGDPIKHYRVVISPRQQVSDGWWFYSIEGPSVAYILGVTYHLFIDPTGTRILHS